MGLAGNSYWPAKRNPKGKQSREEQEDLVSQLKGRGGWFEQNGKGKWGVIGSEVRG